MRAFARALAGAKLTRFFFVALAGVLVDVAIFSLLVAWGARPSLASIISSAIAVCSTYFVSSRAVFGVRYSPARLAGYVLWYAFSITVFSLAIDLCWSILGGSPTLWKVASLPVSFFVNFAVVNFVILRRLADTVDETQAPGTTELDRDGEHHDHD